MEQRVVCCKADNFGVAAVREHTVEGVPRFFNHRHHQSGVGVGLGDVPTVGLQLHLAEIVRSVDGWDAAGSTH